MDINLVELDLSTIQQLQGGAVFKQVQKLIAMAVSDCESRITDRRPRKILLCLEVSPKTRVEMIDDTHSETVLDGLKLRLKKDVKFPTRETIEFDCAVGENHALLFNPDSPHNHRQVGLPLTFESEPRTVPMTA